MKVEAYRVVKCIRAKLGNVCKMLTIRCYAILSQKVAFIKHYQRNRAYALYSMH